MGRGIWGMGLGQQFWPIIRPKLKQNAKFATKSPETYPNVIIRVLLGETVINWREGGSGFTSFFLVVKLGHNL